MKNYILVLSLFAGLDLFGRTSTIPSPTKLFTAINKNDLTSVNNLIKAGVDVNAFDSSGETPLTLAIKDQKLKIVNALLAAADINVNLSNKSGYTPLIEAIKENRLDIVNVLLGSSDININMPNLVETTTTVNGKKQTSTTIGDAPIIWAIKGGNFDIVKALGESTTQPPLEIMNTNSYDAYTALWVAAGGDTTNYNNLANIRFSGNQSCSSQTNKCKQNIIGCYISCLKYQASLNNISTTIANIIKTNIKNSNIVNYYAPNITNPNQLMPNDQNQNTILMFIIENGYEAAAKNLLSNSKLDATMTNNNGDNALMTALNAGFNDIATILLTQSSNITLASIQSQLQAQNYNTGNTPLINIVSSKLTNTQKEDLLNLIMKNSKKGNFSFLTTQNNQGEIPLMIAIQNNYPNIIKTLLTQQAAAQVNTQDNNGLTPLMYAIKADNPSIVNELLGVKGIDLTLQNNNNQNALQYAQSVSASSGIIYALTGPVTAQVAAANSAS